MNGWNKITGYGQVKAGTPIRFTTSGNTIETLVAEVLFAGTDKEEIIYNKKNNYYFLVSMLLEGRSHAKEVEYFAIDQLTQDLAAAQAEIARLRAPIDDDTFNFLIMQSGSANITGAFSAREQLQIYKHDLRELVNKARNTSPSTALQEYINMKADAERLQFMIDNAARIGSFSTETGMRFRLEVCGMVGEWAESPREAIDAIRELKSTTKDMV
jgi:hypothetical protein